MSTDFYKPIQHGRIHKSKAPTRMERGIRLYCTQYQVQWSLQVRGPLGIGSFGMQDGKDDIIASAMLTRADLLALRGAIDDMLKEAV